MDYNIEYTILIILKKSFCKPREKFTDWNWNMMGGDKGKTEVRQSGTQVGEVRNRQVEFVFETVLKIAELRF